MNVGRSIKWRDWRQHIAVRCDELTRGLTPPIPLSEIFEQCHIKRVVFQPLLLEAALAVEDNGFAVYVNCGKHFQDQYLQRFSGAEQNGRYLPARVRFSLAHELIHTFFYDTKQWPCKNKLLARHFKEIDSLEAACNFGASQLLVPTRSLKKDTAQRDVLNIDGVRDLAKRYQVSMECLITRLDRLEDWTPKPGLIALLRRTEDGYRITAVAKSVAVRELFRSVSVGSRLEDSFTKHSVDITNSSSVEGGLTLDVTYAKESGLGVARYLMRYRRIANSILLVISVDNKISTVTHTRKPTHMGRQHLARLREAIGR